MSIPIRSSDELLAALREHPEWREAVRREILTEELLELPAKLEKAELERKEDSRKVWESIQGLTESQQRTEATLKSFMESTQAFQRSMEEFRRSMEEFKDATEKRFAAVEIKLDELDGTVTEREAAEKLDEYLYERIYPLEVLERRLRSRILATAGKIGAITEDDLAQLVHADALAVGEDKKTGEPACAAAEVSTTVNLDDVERADIRSKLFLKALRAAVAAKPKQWEKLLPSLPTQSYAVVIGQWITEEALQEAERRGVLFAKYRNGYDRQGR
ncbi:MAG: hypothetical protein PHO89_11635 [Methylacidiphilaceae bacterium]|nr:hypothetical protein [Candidatus Methylacidiphilaceae bacterium]